MSDVEHLVLRLRTKPDATVKHQLIIHFTPLAKLIGSNLARLYKKEPQELQAAAYLSLCEAIERASKSLYDNNIHLYLSKTIKADVKRLCFEDRIFGPTLRQIIYGCDIPKRHNLVSDYLAKNQYHDLELMDFLSSVLSPIELLIIELRLQNYTDEEIANRFNQSREWVQKYRTKAIDKILNSNLVKDTHFRRETKRAA